MKHRVEIETKPAEISWAGRLDGGISDPEIWSGKIPSAEFMLEPARKEQLKTIINRYFGPVDPSRSVRCIDGRPKENASGSESQGLGPQVPGGTPAAALSYRIALFNRSLGHRPGERRQDVLIDDMLEMTRIWQALDQPFRIGAHDDDHAHYPNTGCGAVDNLPKIMERMADPKALPTLKKYAKAVAEDEYEEDMFMEVVATLRFMNLPSYKARYLQQDPQMDTDYRDIVLAMVKKEADEEAVEKMVGPHKEFAAIVNKTSGHTFDRDRMSSEHDNEVQIFNYDAWMPELTARALFPDDEEARKLYVMSRAMYFAATAMVLTNGQLEVGIRK